MSARHPVWRFLIILVAGLFVGCSSGTGTTASPAVIPTSGSTSTPTIEIPGPTPRGKAPVVLVQQDADILGEELKSWLEETVGQLGWRLEISNQISEEDLAAATRLVIFLHPPANLPTLLNRAPETRFIVFSPTPFPESPNLVQAITPLPQVYFLAGYLSVLVAADYRAGALLSQDALFGEEAVQAFRNGAYYLCGRCVPVYGPIVTFPVTASLPETASEESWSAALEELNKNRLESLFVDARITSPALYEYLNAQPWVLLGNQAPPAGLEARWAATIAFDYHKGLEDAWKIALSDEKSTRFNVPLSLNEVNPALLSPGRQKMAEKIIAALQSDQIYPLTPP